METLQISKANALKAFKEANDKGKLLLSNLFGEKVFSQKITDRVKSFENACEIIGEDPEDVLPYKYPKNKRQHALNDYARLDVIAEALQQEYQANWADGNEYKWRP